MLIMVYWVNSGESFINWEHDSAGAGDIYTSIHAGLSLVGLNLGTAQALAEELHSCSSRTFH